MKISSLFASCALAISAAFAASPDAAKTRQLIGVVQSNAELADRARALQQLALVATPDAVPLLAGLLGDEHLGQYARDGLERMPDAAAGAALRDALGRLQGNALIGVVHSLGQRREAAAVPALEKLAAAPQSVAAPAAVLALGRIATPGAVRVLGEMLARGTPELRAAAAEGSLFVAAQDAVEGRATLARRRYDAVRRADVPLPLRLTATRGAILTGGPDAMPLLLAQLRSDDPDFRDLALRTARDVRDPALVPAFIAELDRLPPPQQAAVLSVLVDRNDPAALAAIEARAAAGAEAVRIAALRALGGIGRASSVPILLQAAGAAGAEPVVEAAWFSLARIKAGETDAAMLAALPGASAALQVRLIGVLGDRSAAKATGALIGLAQGANLDVAKAALRALGQISTPADLPRLIALAIAVKEEAAKSLADRAIVTTAMKVLEPARRSEAVLQAFLAEREPATKAALLRPLGAILRTMGGRHEVFFAVQAALKDPAPVVQAAALRCLADWPDATPVTTLLALANQAGVTPAQREVAVIGAIRMTTAVAAGRERSPLNVADAFAAANRAVRTKEEKMALVAALGSWKRPGALALLQPYLDDPDVKAEAALAVVQVAPALGGARQVSPLKDMLTRIAATDRDDDTRRQAARLVQGGGGPVPKGKAAAAAPANAVLPPLFNGTELTGWDGDPGVWRVRDGTIVGGSLAGNPRNEFLAMTRRTKNFVLTIEYKLAGTEGFVNGGVQFRSVRIVQPPNEMSGYQADIGAGHSGCLYDESRRKKFLQRATDEQIKRLEKVGDWNRLEIRCEGNRVQLSLNGERTVDYTETDGSVAPEGLIALQIHGNCKAEIAFRQLVLTELP